MLPLLTQAISSMLAWATAAPEAYRFRWTRMVITIHGSRRSRLRRVRRSISLTFSAPIGKVEFVVTDFDFCTGPCQNRQGPFSWHLRRLAAFSRDPRGERERKTPNPALPSRVAAKR